MNIFDAIASGDIRKMIAIIGPAFKKAVREASERAHSKGISVTDGRRD